MIKIQNYSLLILLTLILSSAAMAQNFTLTFHEFDDLPTIKEVVHGDFNGDGEVDYIMTGNNSGRLYLAIGNGIGMPEISEIPEDFGVYQIVAVDINVDGNLDFVGSDPFGDESYRWMNDGSGNFTREKLFLSTGYNAIYFVDLDGNDELDIVANFNQNLNIYTFNNGTLSFEKSLLSDPTIGSVGAITSLDYDNDGDLDVVAAYNLGGVNLFSQGFNFNFVQSELFDEFNVDQIYSSDFDNDGNIDFVTQSDFNQSSSLYLNSNTNEFTAVSIPNMFGSNEHTFIGDLGNDGVIDIIHTDGSNPTNAGLSISIYDQSSGELVQTVIAEDHVDTEGGDIVDLNGDGTLDFYLYTNDFFDNGFAFYVASNEPIDNDGDGFAQDEDCDDNNPNVNPGVDEVAYNGIDDDCNPDTPDDDIDQDGFVLADDCDDNNAAINPGVTEEPYNGLDDDCNELTLDDDLDQDGFGFIDGSDCDDDNPLINPDAVDIPNNDIDEDCDGMDAVSGVNDLNGITITVGPNPATESLSISMTSEIQGEVTLYSLTGKRVYHSEIISSNMQIDLTEISSGLYYLNIKDDKSAFLIEEVIIP